MLGTFELCNIPPAPAGVPEIEVTFALDSDGILSVSAKDKRDASGNASHITISNDKARLTPAEIRSMLLMSELFAFEDGEIEVATCARQNLRAYAGGVAATLLTEDEAATKLSPAEQQAVKEALKDVELFLAASEPTCEGVPVATAPSPSLPLHVTSSDFTSRQTSLELVVQPMLKKIFIGTIQTATTDRQEGGETDRPTRKNTLGEKMQHMQTAHKQ